MSSNGHSGADTKQMPSVAVGVQSHSCIMTGTDQLDDICNFESVLLAIAGHDLRQSLQIVQGAQDLLGLGLRTRSELRHLRSGQKALDQLNEQLSQLLIALRMRLNTKEFKLRTVRVEHLLKQACQENGNAAQRKGISLWVVASNALIISDSLLLGAALRNLVSNAIRYTHEGGAWSSVVGTAVLASGLTYTTPESEFPKNICRRFLRRSPASIEDRAIVLVLDSSSYGTPSPCWGTGSRSLPLLRGDLGSPFQPLTAMHTRIESPIQTDGTT